MGGSFVFVYDKMRGGTTKSQCIVSSVGTPQARCSSSGNVAHKSTTCCCDYEVTVSPSPTLRPFSMCGVAAGGCQTVGAALACDTLPNGEVTTTSREALLAGAIGCTSSGVLIVLIGCCVLAKAMYCGEGQSVPFGEDSGSESE